MGLLEGFLEAILWLKMAQDGLRWLKIAPKHENLVKHEGFGALHMANKVCKNRLKSHIVGARGTRRGKMTYDRSSWPKIAPKHENLAKYN